MFKTSAASTPGAAAKFDYSSPIATGTTDTDYVLKGKNYVEIPKNTDALAFGYTQEQLNSYMSATTKSYITNAMWARIWAVADKYYKVDGTFDENNNWASKESEILAADKAAVAVFKAYKSLIDFTQTSPAGDSTPNYNQRAYEIASVNFKLVNKEDAKFFTAEVNATADAETGLTLTATKASLGAVATGYKKVVPREMIIPDIWGKVMTYEFEVEISL